MRPARWLSLVLAVCAVAVLTSTTVAAAPYQATPRCDGVHLRSGPSGSYPSLVTLDHKSTVTVASVVTGSHWSTLCGGSTYSGSKWARIVEVNGVPVQSNYGIKYLYAALGLLVAVPPTAAPSSTPTAPPSAAPTTAPPTAVPTTSIEPTASPSALASPTAAPTASVTPSQTAGPVPAGAGTDSAAGSPAELIALMLALVSVFLAGVAFGDRRRRLAANKVPSSRLNDVLE